MIQISEHINEIKDCYYLDTENDCIYNADNDCWIEPNDKMMVMLKDNHNKTKKLSFRTIYKLCGQGVYCIDTIERLENEIFKPIPNTQGYYLASNMGRIISYKDKTAKLMSGTKTNQGYQRVDLYTDNGAGKQERHTKMVHCLIAETFLGPIQRGYVVHHKDANKSNQMLDNLEILTQKEHKRKHYEMEMELINDKRSKNSN